MADQEIISSLDRIHEAMTNGFNRVYDEIGTVCDRVVVLELDKSAREAACKVKQEAIKTAEDLHRREEDKHINWYKLKNAAFLTACGSFTVAAIALFFAGIKFLFLNFDKWVK